MSFTTCSAGALAGDFALEELDLIFVPSSLATAFPVGSKRSMPRYFFHVRRDVVRFEDRRGGQFADLRAAWNWALGDARRLVEDDALDGIPDQYWIEICDSTGIEVATLPVARVPLH
jgi:hypothetical protein